MSPFHPAALPQCERGAHKVAQENQKSGFYAVADEKRRPVAENIASCLEHCSHRSKKSGNQGSYFKAKYGGAHTQGRIYGDHFTFYIAVLKNNI